MNRTLRSASQTVNRGDLRVEVCSAALWNNWPPTHRTATRV